MFTIRKSFEFSASHQLDGLPTIHPCSRLHGHNYKVEIVLKAKELDEVGFVKDYRLLDEIKAFIDTTLDHRHLNDVFQFNPTAENIAKHLYIFIKLRFTQLYAVTVKETEKTSATYEPDRS
jgi:6-pyruvoyltetrahydropterin/6-carboxytetrahydropterin synthase